MQERAPLVYECIVPRRGAQRSRRKYFHPQDDLTVPRQGAQRSARLPSRVDIVSAGEGAEVPPCQTAIECGTMTGRWREVSVCQGDAFDLDQELRAGQPRFDG